MTDKLGNEITVGCFILYGHAMGRSAGLRLGRVEAVDNHITVLGMDDDWNSRKPKLLSKRSTLLFPNRVVVVNELVPDRFRKLYEKDCVALGKKHTWKPKEGFVFWKVCSVCGHDDHN